MNAVAPTAVEAATDAAVVLDWASQARAEAPTYYAVLFTDCWKGDPPSRWADALRMLAVLAEENAGYLGYDVHEMDGGREYAVTHWSSPQDIRQWKIACGLVIGDNGLLSRFYGQEGCFWPWMDTVKSD